MEIKDFSSSLISSNTIGSIEIVERCDCYGNIADSDDLYYDSDDEYYGYDDLSDLLNSEYYADYLYDDDDDLGDSDLNDVYDLNDDY